MKVRNIDILEIKMVKFDSKTGNMQIRVSFVDDTPIMLTMNISEENNAMAEKVINAVKQQKRPVDEDEGDVLSGIAIINVGNADDVRERFGKGMIRIDQKYDTLKRTRVATDYIKAYSQMSTSEDVIYKKGSSSDY